MPIPGWCYMHNQDASGCMHQSCRDNAGNPAYKADFWNAPTVVDEIMAKQDEPDTLDGGAVELHEFYSSYLRAGFTPKQAIYLVACLMTNSPGLPPSGASTDLLPPDAP